MIGEGRQENTTTRTTHEANQAHRSWCCANYVAIVEKFHPRPVPELLHRSGGSGSLGKRWDLEV